MRRARPAAMVATAGLAMLATLARCGEARAEAVADDAAWELAIDERLDLVVGTVANAKVRLRGRGRYSVARSGLLIDLKPARGLGVRQRRYQRGDAAEGGEAAEASFSIPVRGEAVGAHALELRVRFWVCAAKSCQPIDERRTVMIEVRDPPPPPAPPERAPPVVTPPSAPPPAPPAPKRPGKGAAKASPPVANAAPKAAATRP